MNSKTPAPYSPTKKASANASPGTRSSSSPDAYVLPSQTDVTAERQLIACLLDSPKFTADALELLGGPAGDDAPDILTHEGYRLLFGIIRDLYEGGRAVRLATVLQSVTAAGKLDLLQRLGVGLMDLPAEAHLTEFTDTCVHLRNLWVKRLAHQAAIRITTALRANESASAVVDALTLAAEQTSAGLSVGADPTLVSLIGQSLTSVEAAMAKPGTLTGVNTGLGKVNRLLGGWQPGEVVMIAGRPGSGKTVCGLKHAMAAAESGVVVGFLSLEMPAKALLNRMLSAETGVPYGRIKRGEVSRDEFGLLQRAAGRLEQLPIHFYDEPNTDVNDLTYKLLYWKKRWNLGLVVIDYVQKLRDRTVRGAGEYDVLTAVSDKLQKLAKRLNCPILELAQLNRGVETRGGSKRAGMADLRSTGQFEQDATVIIMLYRDDYYKEKAARDRAEADGTPYEEPVFDHQLEYGFVKSRDGETGTALLWADVSLNRVADVAPPPTVAAQPAVTTRQQEYLGRFPGGVAPSFAEPGDPSLEPDF